jgi:hypothetical protein
MVSADAQQPYFAMEVKMKRLFLVAVLLAPVFANAGVARFTAKHVVAPAAKSAYHGAHAATKAAKKVAF